MSQAVDYNPSADMAWQHSLQLSLNGDPTTWDVSGQMTKPQNDDLSHFNNLNGTNLWDNTVNNDKVQNHNNGIHDDHSQQKVRSGHPKPVVDRSQTEPLWQRRLNAKNKELELLHVVGSSEQDFTGERSPSYSSSNGDHTLSSTMPTSGLMDHDLTHASPETMRMLPLAEEQQQATNNNGVSSGQPSSFSRGYDSYPMQSMQHDSQNYSGDYQYGSNMAYIDAFNNGNMMNTHDLNTMNFMQSTVNGLPVSHNQQQRSPRLYGQAILTNGAKTRRVRGLSSASMKLAVHDLASASANAGNRSPPQSASSVQTQSATHGSGKGMINKVIVPPAPGVLSDAVDVRTGEAGQMRHMCPHTGCDKHFSTSGHARRHSRIHDCLRPFECPHEGCHATFTRRDNCTQHQRARHKYQLVAHRIGGETL
ncbi:uncharacterized protein FA14DRAFT_179763 [Meira miltonrushii]|uniref:C2H2-type domain-containing protein n=1 Tax=Meira miltonrushii TaxID=1280837 RepID=A0A316VFV6_9BASI|nr:uncharacterized protein FA14DRAFT_179763 [Meira miltonrushii]PWN36406.1 hypothetical protein FA14DRAFT_179763 [Meira miltonrushii]